MVNIEIIIGIIALGVILAVFIPLAFDPRGGLDIIICDENEIVKFNFTGGIFVCAVDETTLTEIDLGTFANENTEFRPHSTRGNVTDPTIDLNDYKVRVMEYGANQTGVLAYDYLVPEDYEMGEDMEFTFYWFKDDGLEDVTIIDHYFEQSTACMTTTTTATIFTVADFVEFDFQEDRDYLIMVTGAWGASVNHKGVNVIDVKHNQTVFEGSELKNVVHDASPLPCTSNQDLYKYFWWTLWTPTADEADDDITVNVNATDNNGLASILYDDWTITIIQLDDTAENIDWFFNFNGTDATIGDAFNTPNDAKLQFTPTTTQEDWLVLGTELYDIDTNKKELQSRLFVNGTETDLPFIARAGEAQGNSPVTGLPNTEQDLHSFSRVLSLNDTSQLLEVEASMDALEATNQTRLASSIFALNLNKTFSEFNFIWNDTSIPVSANIPDFSLNVGSIVLGTNPLLEDRDFLVLADIGIDAEKQIEVRVQLDDVDVIPDQTTQSYDFEDPVSKTDVNRWTLISIIDTPTIGNHTLDVDVSDGETCDDDKAGNPKCFITQISMFGALLEANATSPEGQTVCMQIRLMSVDVGEDLDAGITPTFGAFQQECLNTAGGADILRKFVWTVNSTSNPFEAGEVGVLQLRRNAPTNLLDDFTGKVFGLFGELEWIKLGL